MISNGDDMDFFLMLLLSSGSPATILDIKIFFPNKRSFSIYFAMSGTSFIAFVQFIRLDRLFGLVRLFVTFFAHFFLSFPSFFIQVNDNRFYFHSNDLAYFVHIICLHFFSVSCTHIWWFSLVLIHCWLCHNSRQKVNSNAIFFLCVNRSIIHLCSMISLQCNSIACRLLHPTFE